jgi:hypothetical protein
MPVRHDFRHTLFVGQNKLTPHSRNTQVTALRLVRRKIKYYVKLCVYVALEHIYSYLSYVMSVT